MQLIYNGWALTHRPNSPAALHLLTLLKAHPPAVAAAVALPGPTLHSLPPGINVIEVSLPDTDAARLTWEQFKLPGLARAAGADFVHTPDSRASLFASVQTIAGAPETGGRLRGEKAGFLARAADALAYGGMTRARACLWPADLSIPPGEQARSLAPAVHPAFQSASSQTSGMPELPDTYILYHGPSNERSLRALLEVWNWAAGSIGEYYPLLLVGLTPAEQDRLARLLAEYGLTGTARPLPPLKVSALAAVYRRAAALIHLQEPEPWCGSARLALAAGKPVVGLDGERMGALVGPAAYLARRGGGPEAAHRALGAALISVIVEDSLADMLAQAARERSAGWSLEKFSAGLVDIYASLLAG